MKIFRQFAKRLGLIRSAIRSGFGQFKGSGVGRLLADWANSVTSADAVLKWDLKTLRNRARDLERNNDYVRKYLSTLENNVLGPNGVRLEMRVKDRGGEPDRQANDIIETNWKKWSRARNCTVTRRQTWLDVQRLVLRSVARDGACLLMKVGGHGNDYGFALQVLESDHLDHEYNVEELASGNEIRFGVEYDRNRAPVAYWLLEQHEGDAPGLAMNKRRRVDANDVIHVFHPERAEQTTGFPWFASSMARLHQLDGYMEAEVIAARIGSCKMGFYTQNGPDKLPGESDGDGNLITEVEPGMFEKLPNGVDFKSFDPQHPTTAFEGFVKACLRGVASGMGISYNSLAGDLESVNYSSLRQAALEERDNFMRLQAWFIDHVCVPVFEAWLEQVLLNESLGLPAARFRKFNEPEFKPRRWGWVDPLKDINAQVIALQNGLKSRRQIIQEQGGSIDETALAIALDAKLFDEHGIELSTGEAPKVDEDDEEK